MEQKEGGWRLEGIDLQGKVADGRMKVGMKEGTRKRSEEVRAVMGSKGRQ